MDVNILRPLVYLALCGAVYSCTSSKEGAVERFVEASNAHDVEAMLSLTVPNLRWMSVSNGSVSVETSGQDDLRLAMQAYFASVPTARSQLRSINYSGNFATTVERAAWVSGDEQNSQCSIAVYRLGEGKIADVWYFPAHACE